MKRKAAVDPVVETPKSKKQTVEEQRAKAAEWYEQQKKRGSSPAKAKVDDSVKKTADVPVVRGSRRGRAAAEEVVPEPVPAAAPSRTPRKAAAVVQSVSTVEKIVIAEPVKKVVVNKRTAKKEESSPEPVMVAAPKIVESRAAVADIPAAAEHEDDVMVDIFTHFLGALSSIFKTVLPVFILMVFVCYIFAHVTGWSNGNIFAHSITSVGLAFSFVLVFYCFALFPLILLTRTVDRALFKSGGSVLTSSLVEFSILAFLVVGSLLVHYSSFLDTAKEAVAAWSNR